MDMPSGVVSHAQLQGVTINQHHAKLHAADHITTGADPLSAAFRQEIRKLKSATQSFTNTVTLADDADFSWAVKAGIRYGFEMHAYINGPALGGVRGKLITTSGIAGRLTGAMAGGGGYLDTEDIFSPNFIWTWGSADSLEWLHLWGILVPTADDTLKVQWAQGTANASATTVLANSHAMLYPW